MILNEKQKEHLAEYGIYEQSKVNHNMYRVLDIDIRRV